MKGARVVVATAVTVTAVVATAVTVATLTIARVTRVAMLELVAQWQKNHYAFSHG